MEYKKVKESDIINFNDGNETMPLITLMPLIIVILLSIIMIINLICKIYQTILLKNILKETIEKNKLLEYQKQILEQIDTDIATK